MATPALSSPAADAKEFIAFPHAQIRAQVLLGVDGMVSPRNEHAIEASLAKLPGVKASASFASRSLRVEFDRNQCAMPEIVRRLDQLGLRLRARGPSPVKETPQQYLRRVT